MKNLLLLIGAAAFVTATPALAQNGNGQGKAKSHATKGQHKAQSYSSKSRNVVRSRDGGRLYAFNARGTCPPGLAKKNNGCLPPGQAKKIYNVGQRYNRNFGNVWSYNQIPNDLRSRYDFDQSDRYYYRDGYLYQVDPKTMLVQQVISALLR
ncbi:hypothetical protein [Sphingomonas sp. LY160]|uniref:hypothetical protein n=1 Tax=Sphingomonas sp. LY160 TaxID=3095342 RepID=UPI002ADEB64E|nr:hypothetical protein [Sphingomonas sp. LY160]MEA1072059.1 hypothetical protein [Sphingomonas sp. LY160]